MIEQLCCNVILDEKHQWTEIGSVNSPICMRALKAVNKMARKRVMSKCQN